MHHLPDLVGFPGLDQIERRAIAKGLVRSMQPLGQGLLISRKLAQGSDEAHGLGDRTHYLRRQTLRLNCRHPPK